MKITAVETWDVRFPTSQLLTGSDAMHPDPDYSAAYLVLKTDTGPEGHGFVFTIGRGNELCVAAIEMLAPMVVGLDAGAAFADMGAFARSLTNDGQLRWLGPEKGVSHMAAGAVINAMWDLFAKVAGQPVWKLLSDMTPEQIVALVDWQYLTDVLTPGEALAILSRASSGRAGREEILRAEGYPAYTTSPGWLGYSDDLMVELCLKAVADGYRQVKMKVGADPADDQRRLALARATLGPDIAIAVDANQRWDVADAITAVQALAPFDLRWVEEPTSPDDIAGHAAIAAAISPIPVATGEHCHNRVMFKQFLAADAMQVCQIDACRVGGVNENVAILLLAAKFGVPVCPHAGGIGLCELVQHLAMFDFVAVSGSLVGRAIEAVDHLHEHFVDPIVLDNGRYRAPIAPGMSATMQPQSLLQYSYPGGSVWTN